MSDTCSDCHGVIHSRAGEGVNEIVTWVVLCPLHAQTAALVDRYRAVLAEDLAQYLAVFFHLTYERLAPSFGYTTREETRVLDLTSPNGQLMIAVCQEILADRRRAAEGRTT